MLDIVYFVKAEDSNEELRYSLRSIEKNFEHGKVWFYGGCPNGLKPDKWIYVEQTQPNKWERVKNMLYLACKNNEITEDFYLFNDDFFIMKPWEYETVYNKDLYRLIVRSEGRTGRVNGYSQRMRDTVHALENAGYDVKNYAVHMPIKLNRKKVLETLNAFPGCSMFRSLYGNYNDIGGVDRHDCKIQSIDKEPTSEDILLSTNDDSFRIGKVGEFIRAQFPNPCKYELPSIGS